MCITNRCMNPDELFGKDYNTFCEVDPFNKSNTVEGFISKKSNEYYGAMFITKINNKVVEPQLVMGIPKMGYPFDSRTDGTRNYKFPSAKDIEIFEKIDGTGVLSFFYYDDVNRYMSFKTRLRPFLGNSKFGNFYEMWNEIASNYFQLIKQTMIKANCNLAYELYGSRNPITIQYKVPLAFALLFGVTNAGNILSPTDLTLATKEHYVKLSNIPLVNRLGVIDKDYVWNYTKLQEELELELSEKDGLYSGREGAVWYLHSHDGKCVQLKCKPETIEDIHFASGGLNKIAILNTIWNAFENEDTPSLEFVKKLLEEDFSLIEIEKKHYVIKELLDYAISEKQFRQNILDEYRKTGKSILIDKVAVMRELSTKFNKNDMKKVYSTIISFA